MTLQTTLHRKKKKKSISNNSGNNFILINSFITLKKKNNTPFTSNSSSARIAYKPVIQFSLLQSCQFPMELLFHASIISYGKAGCGLSNPQPAQHPAQLTPWPPPCTAPSQQWLSSPAWSTPKTKRGWVVGQLTRAMGRYSAVPAQVMASNCRRFDTG